MKKRKYLCVSVSGGRSSAASAIIVNRYPNKYWYREVIYVFSNTGLELPETITFLRRLEAYLGVKIHKLEFTRVGKEWGYKKIERWEDLNMNGLPFREAVLYQKEKFGTGMPNMGVPYCSGMLKRDLIRRFCFDYFGHKQYASCIGFRAEDMPKRITLAEIKESKGKILCPLLTHYKKPYGQKELNAFFRYIGFKLELNSRQGNCTLCWKKSAKNLAEIVRAGIAEHQYAWWREMEKITGNTSFRGFKSIDDIIKESSVSIPDDDIGESCECGI